VKLKNETLFTPVRPYSGNTAYKQEEHDALHSKLKNSNTSYPHSFVAHPVHMIPGDFNSEMVAYVGGGFAWDFALRNLLPLGVDGIIVELKNNCNQSFTYEIEGPDAYFVGDGELHEPKYNKMEAVRSLSFASHPNFSTTPGHCYYYMVSSVVCYNVIYIAYLILLLMIFDQPFYRRMFFQAPSSKIFITPKLRRSLLLL
jgi:hypothetical protein